MAKQTINNGEVGLDVRDKLNDNFTELYADSHTHSNKSTLDATQEAFTTTLKNKLDDIEASADVTDATNVDAAGAVMNSDTSTSSMSFVVDEDDMTSNSATKVPTQQSVKTYTDAQVFGIINDSYANSNLLSDSVALCEDSTLFTPSSGVTLSTDTTETIFGTSCIKTLLTADGGKYGAYDIISLIDTSKYYLISGYVKNEDATTGLSLKLIVTGGTNPSDSDLVTATTWTRVGLIVNSDNLSGATAVNIRINIQGLNTEYGYFDGLQLREITAYEYAEGTADIDTLLDRYPFAYSKGIPSKSEIISLDSDSVYEGQLDAYLNGRTVVNLLEDDVAGCEVTTNWTDSGVTSSNDSSNNLEGNNCRKLTRDNSTAFRSSQYDILSLLNLGSYYLITAYFKNVDISGDGLSVRFVTDDESVASDATTSTVWTRVGLVVKPTDFDTATTATIGLYCNSGSTGEYAYADGVMLTEITAYEYSLGADAIMPYYPYHRGMKSVECGREKSVGKNLFDKNDAFDGYYINLTTGALTSSPTGTYIATNFIKIASSATYVQNFGANQSSTAGVAFYNAQKEYISGQVILNSNKQISTPSSATYLRTCFFKTDGATLDNSQLEQSSSATTYEPYKSSQAYIPQVLRSVPNGTCDSWEAKTGKVVKRCEEYTLQSGDITGLTTSDVNADYVTVNVQSDALPPTANEIDGLTIIEGFNGEVITDDRDQTSSIGKFESRATTYRLVVANGTYADLASAQAGLAGTKIVYALDPSYYTITQYPPSTLASYKSGTIYNEIPEDQLYNSARAEIVYSYPTTPRGQANSLSEQVVNLDKKFIATGRTKEKEISDYIMPYDEGVEQGELKVKVNGRTVSNLLDDDVAGCESTSGWQDSAVNRSTDSANELEGTNCIKLTLTGTNGYIKRDVLSLIDSTKYYLYSAHAKNGNLSGSGARIYVNCIGGAGVIDTTSYTTETNYSRQGLVLKPSDFDTASEVSIRLQVAGSVGEYGFFDAIQLTEITAQEYSLGADAIMPYYPYHKNLGSIESLSFKSVGKNLFDWNNIEVGSLDPSTGQKQVNTSRVRTNALIPVKKNQDYTFNLDGFGLGESKSVIGYSSSNFDSYVEDLYDSSLYDSFTFNTGNSSYIGIKVNEPYSSFENNNIQLELGTSSTSYEPYKSSKIFLPQALRSVPNGTKDEWYADEGKVVKKCEEYVLQSGDIDSLVTSATNFDYVLTVDMSGVIPDIKAGTSGIDGQLIINGFPKETTSSIPDVAGNTYAFRYGTDGRIQLSFPKGTFADVAAARTALTSTVTTKIVYELDPSSYETSFHEPSTLLTYKDGTLYTGDQVEEQGTYSSGLSISDTELEIGTLDEVYLVEYGTNGSVTETPIAISDCTIDSDKQGFTISGASAEEYRYIYTPIAGRTAPYTADVTYTVGVGLKEQSNNNSEMIVRLQEEIRRLHKMIAILTA